MKQNPRRAYIPLDQYLNDKAALSFWAKVDKIAGPDGCWPWTGASFPRGYGNFRGIRANRLAYAYEHGKDPCELHVCHSCDNPPCCNPKHLFLGTAADNAADRDQKGRRRGTKLSAAQVDEVSAMLRSGVPAQQIAKVFGTVSSVISKIRNGRRKTSHQHGHSVGGQS